MHMTGKVKDDHNGIDINETLKWINRPQMGFDLCTAIDEIMRILENENYLSVHGLHGHY